MPSPFDEDFSQEGITSGRSRNQPSQSLGDILGVDFREEFERLQGGQSDLEQRLFDAINAPVDFEAFRGQLSGLAESVTGELFGAGGQVELATRGAAGRTVETGFGTSSGGFDRARQNIFGQARESVANVVGQSAVELSGQAVQQRAADIGALGDFTQFQTGRLDDLRESLFGGQVTIEQLNLAKEQMAQNQRLIDEAISGGGGGGIGGFLGKVGGGILGSALGPIGAGLGAKVGESLFGGGGDDIDDPRNNFSNFGF